MNKLIEDYKARIVADATLDEPQVTITLTAENFSKLTSALEVTMTREEVDSLLGYLSPVAAAICMAGLVIDEKGFIYKIENNEYNLGVKPLIALQRALERCLKEAP